MRRIIDGIRTEAVPRMSYDERYRYCLARRKDLEIELKDAELMVGIIKKHLESADKIIEDIRMTDPPLVEL